MWSTITYSFDLSGDYEQLAWDKRLRTKTEGNCVIILEMSSIRGKQRIPIKLIGELKLLQSGSICDSSQCNHHVCFVIMHLCNSSVFNWCIKINMMGTIDGEVSCPTRITWKSSKDGKQEFGATPPLVFWSMIVSLPAMVNYFIICWNLLMKWDNWIPYIVLSISKPDQFILTWYLSSSI